MWGPEATIPSFQWINSMPHLSVPNVQVPIRLGGESGDHLASSGREVLSELLGRVGDPHEAPIAEVDRSVNLVVVLGLGEECVGVIWDGRLQGENF